MTDLPIFDQTFFYTTVGSFFIVEDYTLTIVFF